MKKQEFINQLRANLSSLPQNEVDDIVRDQEEYISDATASGRNEDEVVTRIGDPKSFAQALVAESRIELAENTTKLLPQVRVTWNAVRAYLAYAPFNLLMIVPFILICCALWICWTLWISWDAIIVSIIVFFVNRMGMPGIHAYVHASTVLFILGLIGTARLTGLLLFWTTKSFLARTLSYMKSNLNLIRKLGEKNV